MRDVDNEEEPGSIFTYDSSERDEICCDCSGVFFEPRVKALRMLWKRLESDALPTTTRRVGRHAAMTAMPPSIKDQQRMVETDTFGYCQLSLSISRRRRQTVRIKIGI